MNDSFSVGLSWIYFIVAATIKCYNLCTILTEDGVGVENTSNQWIHELEVKGIVEN